MKKEMTPWVASTDTLVRELQTNATAGLAAKEAEARLKDVGENTITQSKKITFWDILLEEIKEPLILLLLAIGVLYSVWGEMGDAITILCVILAVSLVEVYTEYKAKKSIEALRTLARPTSWVIRDGKPAEVPTGRIVPGDLLVLKGGVKVGADARVLESARLEVDESQLTGEALGVGKDAAPLPSDTGLNDRTNMVHMGSVILKGKGLAVVTATGMDTELGRIAGLTSEAREPKTPLQKSMKQLSKTLIWVAVFFSGLVVALGILRGLPLPEVVLTGLSFAFATIPEEMPIIITMALGLGAINLSKRNVLIKRTKAAETLGSVTVIATDKTGTLTENKMSIQHRFAKDDRLLFTYAALLADVDVDGDGNFLGDPMDKAVVLEAERMGLHWDEYRQVNDDGFDEVSKTFRSDFQYGEKTLTLLKGAAESVFALSEPNNDMQAHLNDAMVAGYRTIAVACKEEAEELFTVTGIICFDDPIREGVPEAVADCAGAGIKVIMITGDHAATAKRVAESAGIQAPSVVTGGELAKLTDEELKVAVQNFNVFARISPKQKLRIVIALRENGEVVAVTGDGINDAPALKSADIGIAMGQAGTDVAKEAADMILVNDSFTPIVTAIGEGRRLYDNLSKCVKYYLACKVGLILTVLSPMIIGLPVPFSPIQMIMLELFMDLAASTSFVAEAAESDVLKRKPRNTKERFMNRRMNLGIVSGGVILATFVLATYLLSYISGASEAQTLAFAAWLFGHVALAFHMRTNHVPLVKIGVFSSRAFNVWLVGVVSFLAVALNVPVFREYLQLEAIGSVPILCLAAIAIVITALLEVRKFRSKM